MNVSYLIVYVFVCVRENRVIILEFYLFAVALYR